MTLLNHEQQGFETMAFLGPFSHTVIYRKLSHQDFRPEPIYKYIEAKINKLIQEQQGFEMMNFFTVSFPHFYTSSILFRSDPIRKKY